MRWGRRGALPWVLLVSVVACAWCSLLSAVGGWVAGQDLARREAQIEMATVVADTALPPLGMLVTRLERDSPAERAGLQRGDIIVTADGVAVQDARDLRDVLSRLRPGEKLRLRVDRDGSKEDVVVQLGAFPNDTRRAYLGVYYTSRPDQPADL